MTTTEEILHDLYYNKHNYDGVVPLTRKAKVLNKDITQKDVKDWLQRQESYQLNATKHTKRSQFLPIYSENPHSWQLDLTFIPQYRKQNGGNYVLFTAIHINSRYGYVSYATNKRADTILDLMKAFVQSHSPEKIDGDKGSEYTNKKTTDYLKAKHIESNFYLSDSHKLGIINRFHRTLKEKIQKWMSASGSVKWISIIDTILNNYNTTYHSGIRATPKEVYDNPYLQSLIIDDKKAKTEDLKSLLKPLLVNDYIRVKKGVKQFENRMTTKFSAEIYQITKVLSNTVDAVDINNRVHRFKISQVHKINPNVENIQADISESARKVNRNIRLIRKEDLIDAPMLTRTRGGGGKS